AVRALDDLVRGGEDRVLDLGARPLAADEPLGGVDGVLRVGDGLALGDVPDQALAGLGDGHHRRRGLVAAPVRDDRRDPLLDDGHARVRRAEVDADDALHSAGAPARGLAGPTGRRPGVWGIVAVL